MGDRHYFGFTWQHAPGDDYSDECATVSAFAEWLNGLAAQHGVRFL